MDTNTISVEADHVVLPRNEILAAITAPNAPLYLLSTAEIASAARMSKQFFELKRTTGGGPKFLRIGQAIRYRSTDFLEWLEQKLEGGE